MDFHSDVKNGLIHILLLAALPYDARKRVNRRLVAAQRIGATGGLPIGCYDGGCSLSSFIDAPICARSRPVSRRLAMGCPGAYKNRCLPYISSLCLT